jgi:excisionase family DNA binding protein
MSEEFRTIQQTKQITGIGRTRIYQLLDSGTLKAVKYGKSTLVLKSSIDAFVEHLCATNPFKGKQTA